MREMRVQACLLRLEALSFSLERNVVLPSVLTAILVLVLARRLSGAMVV